MPVSYQTTHQPSKFRLSTVSFFNQNETVDSQRALREHPVAKPPRKRVLFMPASIRSHIVPTLYLADCLSTEYDVYYAVTAPALADIVSENGYTPIISDPFRICVGMEAGLLQYKKRNAGFWQILYSVYKNDVYNHRKQELDKLMTQLKPDIVIIDIFSSTDFLALYSYRSRVRLLFCNPMLSTYRVDQYPIVSESEWPKTISPVVNDQTFSLKRFMRDPRAELYQAAIRYQWKTLSQLIGLSVEHKVIETPFTRLFANVPELILAPLEFEVSPEVQRGTQHYLGLCVRQGRRETEVDPNFDQQWPSILAQKQTGQRIVYCSFGTFYTGPDRTLITFIENLLHAVSQLNNVLLICSVNQPVIETVRAWHQQPSNVHFFYRVPQLHVLQKADLFITHGGLGSIKESIHYGVPMLVYPLDPHYDQPGNGLKVEYHKLGLRGDFQYEQTKNIQAKIQQLLSNKAFTTQLRWFKSMMEDTYKHQAFRHIFTNTHYEANAR